MFFGMAGRTRLIIRMTLLFKSIIPSALASVYRSSNCVHEKRRCDGANMMNRAEEISSNCEECGLGITPRGKRGSMNDKERANSQKEEPLDPLSIRGRASLPFREHCRL